MRRSFFPQTLFALVLVFSTVAACSPDTSEKKNEAKEPVTASLVVHRGTVVAMDYDIALSEEELKETLPEGTHVWAGEDSLVEIAWSDGSVTRLDSNSSFKIGADKDRGQLTDGRSWHRVSEQGSDNFDLTLSDGTDIATSGTGFMAECDAKSNDCSVFLLEGGLTVGDTTLDPLTWTTVTDGMVGEAQPLTWTAAPASDFAKENSKLDGSKGTSLEDLYKNVDPSLASPKGLYVGKHTFTAVDCQKGDCVANKVPKKGEVGDRTYEFAIECGKRLPCQGQINTSWIDTKAGTKKSLVPLTFDGKVYSWNLKNTHPACVWSAEFTEGTITSTLAWTAKPTKAEFLNDDFVATEIEGTTHSKNTTTKAVDSPACKKFEFTAVTDGKFTAELGE